MDTARHDDPTAVPASHPREVDVPPASLTAPAVKPPRWSGKKTAVAAALAITFASAGTLGAAAAMPSGTGSQAGGASHGRMGQFGPDGSAGGRFGQGMPGGPMGQSGTTQQSLPDPAQQGLTSGGTNPTDTGANNDTTTTTTSTTSTTKEI